MEPHYTIVTPGHMLIGFLYGVAFVCLVRHIALPLNIRERELDDGAE